MRWLLFLWLAFHLLLCGLLGPLFGPEALAVSFVPAFLLRTLGWVLSGLFARPEKSAPDPLDAVIYRWTANDAHTLRDQLRSVAIFGASGSGKSSGSGYQLGKALVAHPNSSGLILGSKPEDRAFWEDIFAQAGRKSDLLIFGPDEPLRFNVLDFFLRIGLDTLGITQALLTIGETLQGGESRGGDNGQFWRQQNERMLHAAIEIVKLASGAVSAPDLQKFIVTAATSPQQYNDPDFRQGFHSQLFEKAHGRAKSSVEQFDYDVAREFWAGEYPTMDPKTRANILAGVMGTLSVFNSGVVRELLSTTTNVSPSVAEQRRWLMTDMPATRFGASGAFVNAALKFAWQRYLLNRAAKPGDPFVSIFADEAQGVCNSFDPLFLAECRSHLGCMVWLTQSIHSYHAAMKGEAGKSLTEALLSNFNIKIFHSLGDAASAQYASSLLGKKLEVFSGGSSKFATSWQEEMFGGSDHSGSYSEQYTEVLQPAVFLGGTMRTGGKANGGLVDGTLIRNSERWSSGNNYLFATFAQPKRG